jgi:hypothetical protein
MSLRSVGITHGPRDSPRANQFCSSDFHGPSLPDQDRSPYFPVAGTSAADKARVCTSLPVDLLLVVGAWRLLLLYANVCISCRDGCVHRVRTRQGLPTRHDVQV